MEGMEGMEGMEAWLVPEWLVRAGACQEIHAPSLRMSHYCVCDGDAIR